jgi:hypothetical protein
MLKQACLTIVLLMAVPLWSQVDSSGAMPINPTNDTPMLTPPPVSGQVYPSTPTSEARSNYLRYGMTVNTAYSNNAPGSTTANSNSDASYSLWPTISLDKTTSTLHSVLTYSPGFTFYQKTGGRNEADQNAIIDVQYRMTPHLTFNARDGFQKSSSIFNQPDFGAGGVSGGGQGSNVSAISPIAALLQNSGNVGVTYQFAANGMVGATGTFSTLHYPNPAEVPGLFDSSSQAGSLFYSFRATKMHYFGVTYQYQRLVSYPSGGQDETQTHAIEFFYTLYASPRLSLSFFGGPQHSNTSQPLLPAALAWNPSMGASMSWQGRLTTAALSYSHTISGGGGLSGAVRMDSASTSMHQQITRTLSGSLAGSYVQNDVLASVFSGANYGHTISGSISVQKQFGDHISLQFGYNRLHQSYSNVKVLSATPDTNREFVSISYQFSRPLGQ